MSVITDEPTLVTGLVSAVLILLVAFGVPITNDEKAAILGLVSAAIMLAGAVIVRTRVTPTAHVDAMIRAVQTVPDGTVPATAPAAPPVDTVHDQGA